MLVEDDARSWPPDGGGAPDHAQHTKKMMAEIDVFGFKIIAKSCSQAAKGAGRKDTSMHVQLRNGNNKLEIESTKRKETVISVNQTSGRVEIPDDATKMDWVSVLSSGQLKDSYRDDSSVRRKAATQFESIRSQENGVGRKETSPAEDGATAAAKIQASYEKKLEPMSCKDATQKANSFSTEQEGEEISIFSAEKYFAEEEPTVAARSDEISHARKTIASSGFCFHIGEAQQCRPCHEAKSESTTDLEFPASTASESDIWGSGMGDGDSLANFKKNSLQKTGSVEETNSILSTENSPLKKKHEEACLFRSDQMFELESKKEKLGETQLPSSKVQWHLAQVNSHEFVMSPRLQFSESSVCPSSSKEDRTICTMKQEADEEHGSQALKDPRAFEVARDEFSFESLSSSCEISPQIMQKTAAARDLAVSYGYGDSYRGSDSDYVRSSWTSPVQTHKQNNEHAPYSYPAAIYLRTKSSSPFASPDFLIDKKKECYNVPILNRSFSDLREISYQSPGNYLKMHGRNESDDYQSDMSADLFEIDRLEAPSSVSSSPTSPPRISFWEPTTPLAMP
ncbi:hypothetical protein O6H91_19G076600 [Diphasiastrum complanatum]|nr:hypothetical protein O6H91_19G076600 [Diphasiastrum complanatum]